MNLAHYQCFSADEATGSVLRAIEDRPTGFITILRRLGGEGAPVLYYTRRVNRALLDRLRAFSPDTPLGRALDLHEGDATMRPVRSGSLESTRGVPKNTLGATALRALVSDEAGLVGLESGSSAVRTQALYPLVSCSHKEVTEGDTIEVSLSLSDRAMTLLAPRILVTFPEGFSEIDVLATVSEARGFARPEGEAWSRVFTVKRAARISTRPWVFRAEALASERYEITITFSSGAASVGHVTLTLPPSDRPSAMTSTISVEPIAVRPPRPGMAMIIRGAVGGYEVELSENGEPASEPIPWPNVQAQMFAQICNAIESAPDRAALRTQGKAVWMELPEGVGAWLCRPEAMGVPLTIQSAEPILPFEAAVLVRAKGAGPKPILGVDRPVMRWVPGQDEPPTRALDIARVACIRPDYAEAMAEAIEEEADLRRRVAESVHVGTAKELQALLDGGGVPLVHFAGHAKGAPNAGLVMDKGVFPPVDFLDTELMSSARPFVFLNACRAGFAQPGMFAAFVNFPRTLLEARASGLIVSVIQVKVDAAKIASRIFYDAIGSGANVGEAVRRIREAALTGDTPAHAASYLSYLAYASPDLELRLHAAPLPSPSAS